MSDLLQDWVSNLNWQKQGMLIMALRTPDNVPTSLTSPVIRWMRRCTLYSPTEIRTLSNPYDPAGGNFMGPSITAESLLKAAYTEYYNSTVGGSNFPAGEDVFAAQHGDEVFKNWPIAMHGLFQIFATSMAPAPFIYVQQLLNAVQVLSFHHPDEVIRQSWYEFAQMLVNGMGVNLRTLEEFNAGMVQKPAPESKGSEV